MTTKIDWPFKWFLGSRSRAVGMATERSGSGDLNNRIQRKCLMHCRRRFFMRMVNWTGP